MCFKGAGTLDPRGYPLLYVGSGDENSLNDRPRMYIISLITGEILYQYGDNDQLAYRTDNDQWCAFDSAPLIHAGSDTLIWPGENGNLYTIRLNTSYNPNTGSLTLSPEAPVLTRYLTERTNPTDYWCGYEASPVIVGNYLYTSENGGMFYCIDLNTMELVWAQDTKDDSNSTPVFERVSETQGYLYTAPSLHWTKDSSNKGTVSIYKLDAVTGEIIWEVPYNVHTVSGVSGGVQASPVLGKPGTDLEGMVFYAIARTDTRDSGTLVALDTKTGQEKWRLDMDYYAWSSPLAVYDDQGHGYLVQCDSYGNATFLDSQGNVVDTLFLGGNTEASPAAYNDMIVVGTRLKKICGIKIR
jgi:outer membrane protein assembly factor BamB